jgi:prepilin-type N-terminal cleavage/methylation domain-containing protein
MKFLAPFWAASSRGFTLIEMIVVVFLLALAMLGILSVFDASARINKSESDVADAQGAVRYGIYSMTKAIRMAGSGGLYVSQAVLNHADPDSSLPGISVTNVDPNSYDNVQEPTTVTSLTGVIHVRPGTDMIEVRGVINSPLLGFDLSTGCEPCNPVSDPSGGCAPCTGARGVDAAATTHTPHVNDDVPNRQQFSQIDDYTAGATAANPMFVLVAFNDDMHPNCTTFNANSAYSLYPQPPYNVGTIEAPTRLVGGSPTFGTVNFADARAMQFNSAPGGTETPGENGAPAQALKNVRHAGILDDMIFFIDNGTDALHQHPSLAQGIRRGNAFDVVTLADDVEDMQIAYGVDIDGNGDINRIAAATASDSDSNVSSVAGGDEWVPNVPGNDNPITGTAVPYAAANFYDLPNHCPRLHAVMISLVAKSHDPDLTYKGPSALGLRTMNSPVTVGVPPRPITAQYPGLPNASFRRRVQTLKINLRNYSYQGLGPTPVPAP